MGLRWRAIDFENNLITIDHTVVQCMCDGTTLSLIHICAVMSELPDLSAQKPYALDQLAQLQGKIIQLSKSCGYDQVFRSLLVRCV